MAPGEGKTIVGLRAASLLNVTTLVIVHKNLLMTQWKERIEACLPNAKVGFVQGDVEDVEGKDIVICTVQSIIREGKYDEGFFERFGFVIIDEAHRNMTHCDLTYLQISLQKSFVRLSLSLGAGIYLH
jgi:superfamily II DNA or RNA helicase